MKINSAFRFIILRATGRASSVFELLRNGSNKAGFISLLPLILCAALLLTTSCGASGNNSSTENRATGTNSAKRATPASRNNKVPDVDGCALVTKDEAEAIIGKFREDPKPVTALEGEKTCNYRGENGSVVTLRVYGADHWELQKNVDSESHPMDVSGLGEEAYYTKNPTGGVDLWTRKGNAVLNVNGSIGLDKAKDLAQKALGRL